MYNGAEKRMGKGCFCREFAVKTNKIKDLNTVKTVVVKIGTSTLAHPSGPAEHPAGGGTVQGPQ